MKDGQAIRALVKCLQTPDGVAVFDVSNKGPIIIGTSIDQCHHKFGAEVVFTDYITNYESKKTDRTVGGKKSKSDPKKKDAPPGIDKDP